MYLDIREDELQQIYEEILTILGAYTIDVDVTKEEVLIFLRRSQLIFEKHTSIWQLHNQFGNVYGTPAGLIQQGQLAVMNFSLVQQITDWFASMARVGGKIPWHKDYIILEPGRQIYDLSKESSKPYPSGTRRIHRVLWVARPDTFGPGKYTDSNKTGDDILNSNNWNFGAGGLNYGTTPLGFLGYSFDTILMMQSQEQRNKLFFSEFFHNLSGDMLEITPMPGVGLAGIPPGHKLFYYYWDESEVMLNGPNENLSIDSEATSTIGGMYGLPAGQSNLIANPLQMKIDYILWSQLSPWAKSWIFDYTLAYSKYTQASKWRKIKKIYSTGEMSYDIEFDYQSLLSEANEEMSALVNTLRDDLKELNVVKMIQDKAEYVDAASKIMGKQPRIWKFM